MDDLLTFSQSEWLLILQPSCLWGLFGSILSRWFSIVINNAIKQTQNKLVVQFYLKNVKQSACMMSIRYTAWIWPQKCALHLCCGTSDGSIGKYLPTLNDTMATSPLTKTLTDAHHSCITMMIKISFRHCYIDTGVSMARSPPSWWLP